MCKVLNINRQNYYKYRKTKDKDYNDYLLIKEVFDEGKGMYGARRIKIALKEKYGLIANIKKIRRIMKKYDIKVKYHKIYKKPKNKCIEENVQDNLIKRDFKAKEKNTKWVTDITHLKFNGKRAYLSSIMDLYTRNIVSYKIGYKMDNSLVIDTLNEAIAKEKDVTKLILHSDRGAQYTSFEYKAICESNGIQISMSQKGTPADNSPIESFHSSLKRETLKSYHITSLTQYIDLVKDWIKFYNNDRIRLTKENT